MRTFDGMVVLSSECALVAKGFGSSYSTGLFYNNFPGLGGGFGWVPIEAVGRLHLQSGRVFYYESPYSIKEFRPVGAGFYEASYFVLDRLYFASSQYYLTSPDGTTRIFNSTGQLIEKQNPGGLTIEFSYSGVVLDEVSATDGTDEWKFAYLWGSAGVSSIDFSINGNNVRRSEFAYDGGGRLLTIKNYAYISGSLDSTIVEAVRYSYDSSNHRLRHVVTPTGYRQMVNNGLNPDTASDADLDDYAETEYVYDGSNRVSVMHTHGRTYEYSFAYHSQNVAPVSLNFWTARTRVTRPDGTLVTYYFNRGGQVMLKQVTDSATSPTKTWNEYAQQFQEGSGRTLVIADHDAVDSVNEGLPALVTLENHTGLVARLYYHGTGHPWYSELRKGVSGSPNIQREFHYVAQSVGAGRAAWALDSVKEYRGEGSTDVVETTASCTFHSGTFQLSQVVLTLPVVPTGENGTGTAVQLTHNFDGFGYPTSSVDERGTVTQYTYNKAKGALFQKVENYGGGVHEQVTDYLLDDLGRTVRMLGPQHDMSLNGTATPIRRAQWTYYKDPQGEVVTFGGYFKVSGGVEQAVGPVTIRRPNVVPPDVSTTYAGYRASHTIDAAWQTTGIPLASTTYAQNTWVRWKLGLYSMANQLTEERTYFAIPSSGYGSQSVNYGKRLFAYDAAGRLNETTCAGGTIDETTFNAMGWAVEEKLGTSAGRTVTRVNEYNDNGTLKKVTLPVDSTSGNDRVVEFSQDYRYRLTEAKSTVDLDTGTTVLFSTYAYNNGEKPVTTEQFHTSVTSGNRTAKQTMAYDPLGRLYRRATYAVSSTGVTGNALTDNWYYDVDGQIAREAPSGSALTTITQYDVLGRVSLMLQATGTFSTSAPASVANAVVMEQTASVWDKGGNLLSLTTKQRFDNATGNGELNTTTSEPKARASYRAIYADGLGRTVAEANYGTNQAGSWTRPGAIPAGSNTVLLTQTQYSPAGNVLMVTNPAGIVNLTLYDNADRLTVLVENYPTGSSSSSSSSSGYATDTRTTRYEYTDDGWLKKLKSDNAATGQQITQWVYGVTPSGGQGLYSNRLVREKKYPDYSGGTDLVSYTYNRQRQVTGMTNQAGTAHTYTYDKLGRPLADSVTAFGTNVDEIVNQLAVSYNARGLLVRASSNYVDDNVVPIEITILNEVKLTYNDFNQLHDEFQAHDGVVDSSTPSVSYQYADGTGNTIRPIGLTYPNSHAITLDYGSGLDSALSRPQAIKESSGAVTIASFRFLGMYNPVGLKYDAAAGAEWTMLNGGSGDGGDIYTGLDRFGRLVETIWKTSAAELVHTTFGRNRLGGVTWQRNVLAHAISPTTPENTRQDNFYWYDALQQNYQHQRGDLAGSAPNYTGITNLQQTEVRSFDETGNWLSDFTSSPSLTQSRVHNTANEIVSLSGPGGVVQPVYDLGNPGPGNMTTFPPPGAWTATAYAAKWDAWDRLVELKQGSTIITSNIYDALTRRIRKTDATETRDYYYDKQWRSVEEHVGSNVNAQYVWNPLDRWTLIRRKRSVASNLDETKYLLRDNLDPAALLNTAGAVDERFSYDSFGTVRIMDENFVPRSGNTSAYNWNFLFHAEFIDNESGLYNYGFRFYHPTIGRWISRDPLEEFESANLYLLSGNNPNLIDVLGLAGWQLHHWIPAGGQATADNLCGTGEIDRDDYTSWYYGFNRGTDHQLIHWGFNFYYSLAFGMMSSAASSAEPPECRCCAFLLGTRAIMGIYDIAVGGNGSPPTEHYTKHHDTTGELEKKIEKHCECCKSTEAPKVPRLERRQSQLTPGDVLIGAGTLALAIIIIAAPKPIKLGILFGLLLARAASARQQAPPWAN